MVGDISPCPHEPDVRLVVLFAPGVRMDFVACLTAALRFVQDWQAHKRHRPVAIVSGGTDGLTRLPNERLYLHP
ncbi:hypothetical protein B0T44_00315 [Nocardia donostiensis]|uniref:Uncharacterized protein n=1 Tax=Nocardia donostiensis TaxID=1538463 RepID=A0A1V2TD39_9NOCA|nr:hypothetical protein B0T46_17720 [Nocardia donostiensis]OQS24120.1 hypothetical protein B0T44_00315 [Nocardia donostiensis]